MQIVIDVPDGCYEELCNARFPVQDAYRLVAWIMDGTPLPDGHGRLIDAKAYYDNIKKHYFDNTTVMRCTEIGLGCIPTIIEADKV